MRRAPRLYCVSRALRDSDPARCRRVRETSAHNVHRRRVYLDALRRNGAVSMAGRMATIAAVRLLSGLSVKDARFAVDARLPLTLEGLGAGLLYRALHLTDTGRWALVAV